MKKGKKSVTFALVSTYGTTMDLHKEGVNMMVDEKVTVISSVVHTVRLMSIYNPVSEYRNSDPNPTQIL